MAKKRKTYTREFKVETVKLITERGENVSQVALDMGIHENTLYKWIRELSTKPEEAFPGKGHMVSDAEELRRLKRENERLKMERDILKKAWPSSLKTRSSLPADLSPSGRVPGFCHL